jgi:hypothetical protein
MDAQIIRPDFGDIASLGTLYDAKTDRFLPNSILIPDVAAGLIAREQNRREHLQLSYEASYADKFKRLGVGPELSASILCDFVSLRGSGCFLREQTVAEAALYAAVYHTLSTVTERLDVRSDKLKACLTSQILRTSEVSHVVVEIEYGATSVIAVQHRCSQPSDAHHLEAAFRKQMEAFESSLRQSSAPQKNHEASRGDQALLLDIVGYCSTLDAEGIVIKNIQEARDSLASWSRRPATKTPAWEDQSTTSSYP